MFNREMHEFAVYSLRSRLIKYVVISLIFSFFYILLPFFFLYIFIDLFFFRKDVGTIGTLFMQFLMVLCFLITAATLALVLLTAISTFRRFSSREPALLVTLQGVYLRDLPVTGSIFFPWYEIASLSIVPVHQSYSRPINYFCLQMKDRNQFLARFHPLQRLLIQVHSSSTNTLISTPQWFLVEPVENILLYVRETFQREMRANNVQILDMRAEKGIL